MANELPVGPIEYLKLFFNIILAIETIIQLAIDLVTQLLFVIVDMHEMPLTGNDMKQIKCNHYRLLAATQKQNVAVLIQPQFKHGILTVQIDRHDMSVRVETLRGRVRLSTHTSSSAASASTQLATSLLLTGVLVQMIGTRETNKIVVESNHER